MTTQHTPTPFQSIGRDMCDISDKDGKLIAEVFFNGNVKNAKCLAAFIVRACNAHSELVAALRLIARQAAADRNDLLEGYARAALAKVQP